MLASMSASQLRNWRRYFEIEPWGPIRDDYRFGLLIALLESWMSGQTVDPRDIFSTLRSVGGGRPRAKNTTDRRVLRERGAFVDKLLTALGKRSGP